jgi:hypothetical protein
VHEPRRVNGVTGERPSAAAEGSECYPERVLEEMLLGLDAELSKSDDQAAGTHAAAIAALLAGVRGRDPCAADGHLAEQIAAAASKDCQMRAAVTDVISAVARRLAPDDDPPDASSSEGALWRALVSAADRLYGGGVAMLGRLPFLSDGLLEAMRVEARSALPALRSSTGRDTGPAGRLLAHLAVSRKLQEAIGAGLGRPVSPALRAVYLYDPPGSHVRTHLDRDEYEITLHVVLEHVRGPGGPRGSALVTHLPGEIGPTRLRIASGEAVALCGRGTLHSWQRLAPHEHRTMIGIGWVSAGRDEIEPTAS